MTKRIKKHLNVLSVEEFANTLTHGLGLLLSILGFIVLLVLAGLRGGAALIGASVVYGLSLVVLYAASTIYHGATTPKAKKRLQIVDHCCIYLLIAGSYTPFGMVLTDGEFGRWMLVGIWAFAVVGILIKLFIGARFPALNVISYLVMGWIGALAIEPMFNVLGTAPVVLAIAGGVAYSLGVIFFPWKSIRHHHAIFHVFILAGSMIHYAAIVLYVVPHIGAA